MKGLIEEMRRLGSERNRAGMVRYGINVENAFGASVYDIRKIASRVGTDHDLALALWKTGNREARLLACFVDDPSAVSRNQMEDWARGFDSWDICDQATTSLFDRTRHAWSKAVEWARREAEWVRRGGFALMAGLAVHDRQASDDAFMRLLPLIEEAASDDRNFVKKAVNWALRNIGKRNEPLNGAAIECAQRILDGGGGTARWIARDALRELRSDKVQAAIEKRRAGDIHVGLLRGINLGSKNRIPMKALVPLFTEAGCGEVRTYIQSGNVLFRGDRKLAPRVPAIVSRALLDRFGMDVPVITRTLGDLRSLSRSNPFLGSGADPGKLHVCFLAKKPSKKEMAALDRDRSPPDEIVARGPDIFLHCPEGMARTRFTNAYFDSTLGTTSTLRRWSTVLKILDLAEQM